MRLYKGRLLDDQTPLERPRLQLVPPPDPIEHRAQSKSASALIVLLAAVVFAAVGMWALWTKGIKW